MDGSERKRKKSRSGNIDGGGRRHKKEDVTMNTTTTTATTPQPTEEEVDEFFTILNRMRVTVKYFKKNRSSNINNEGDIVNIPTVELPELHEAKVDVKVGEDSFVLDLNSMPDGESNCD